MTKKETVPADRTVASPLSSETSGIAPAGFPAAWTVEPGGGSQFRLTVPRNPRVELLRSPIPLEPEDSSHHRQRRGSVPAPPLRAAARPAPDAGMGGAR